MCCTARPLQFCSRRISWCRMRPTTGAARADMNCVPRRSNTTQSSAKSGLYERLVVITYSLDGRDSPEGGSGASNEQTHFDMQCLENRKWMKGGRSDEVQVQRPCFSLYKSVQSVLCMQWMYSSLCLGGPRTFFNRGLESVGSLVRVGGSYVMQRSPGVIVKTKVPIPSSGLFPPRDKTGLSASANSVTATISGFTFLSISCEFRVSLEL